MPVVRSLAALLVFAATLAAFGQEDLPSAPTPLPELLTEAGHNNSRIKAADDSWRAAMHVPRQVSTLPDPTITYQQLGVGNPMPFAGYTTNNFAYVGIGVSQALPYPGKLRLRGEVARKNADVKGVEVDATKAEVTGAVKADYLRLAYLRMTLGILAENKRVADQLIQDAMAHYKVGQGLQEDVLHAQVERTMILRELTIRRGQMEQAEAGLKGLLHRRQSSPAIVPEALREHPLRLTSADLMQMARAGNPQVRLGVSSVNQASAALALAKRDGKPDFNLGYMYQNTDRKYPDYYMFTLQIQFPRRGRVHAEIAEAAENLEQRRAALDGNLEQQLAQVKRDYVTASNDEQLLKEYREGLIPQSKAAYQSTLNAYASGRDTFTNVLLDFVNVLNLKLGQAQVLANHEEALADLETLTGAVLR